MQGDEIRALRRLQREQGLSSHVFMTDKQTLLDDNRGWKFSPLSKSPYLG